MLLPVIWFVRKIASSRIVMFHIQSYQLRYSFEEYMKEELLSTYIYLAVYIRLSHSYIYLHEFFK
jgi:hypothetical protein